MRSPIQAVGADTSVIDALLLCETRGVHHMPLMDGTTLLGVVCACDLEDVALEAPVRCALYHPPITLDVTAPIGDALRCMSQEIAGSVLVTRGGHPVGIVTREDALAAANDAVADFHCEACGARTHLKHGVRGLLCLDCRNCSYPAGPDDELGGSE
ncbi:MAG TPA: CBS domain-containing protein [Polyangiaceae bacterium]